MLNYHEKLITKFPYDGVSLKMFETSIYKFTATSDVSISGCGPYHLVFQAGLVMR
jgi:hypothetical protein